MAFGGTKGSKREASMESEGWRVRDVEAGTKIVQVSTSG